MTITLLEKVAPSVHYDCRKLAKLCGMSDRQLQRYFRTRFKRSPQDWLNERRVLAAQRLLLSGDPVKKVSLDLGYKRFAHITPSGFVKSQLDLL